MQGQALDPTNGGQKDYPVGHKDLNPMKMGSKRLDNLVKNY